MEEKPANPRYVLTVRGFGYRLDLDKETPFLDGGYTAFGHVIEGMEVVKSIAIGDVIEKITITEE